MDKSSQLQSKRADYCLLKLSGHCLLMSDIAALMLAFTSGGWLAYGLDTFVFESGFQSLLSIDTLKQFLIFFGLGICALSWLDMRGHYRLRIPFWETIQHILSVCALGFLFCGFIQFVAQRNFSRLWLTFSWTLFSLLLLAGRAGVRHWLKRRGHWKIPSLLVGDGRVASAALQALARERRMGFTIIRQMHAAILDYAKEPGAWRSLMRACGASHIFLALEPREWEEKSAAIRCLARDRLPLSFIPPFIDLPVNALSTHRFLFNDIVLLQDINRLQLKLPAFMKRSFDIGVASLLLLLLMPAFLGIAIMVKSDGGPIFFTQERIGRNRKRFSCYKFRSMHSGAEHLLEQWLSTDTRAAKEWQTFQKLKEDIRITRFGRVIRLTSLDELPQLLNVIKGDMSLVGPRPILPEQEHYYADDLVYYESVRPGLTGPWQVSGRNRLAFDERVRLEAHYARNWSLWLDIVILFKTLPAVIRGGNAY